MGPQDRGLEDLPSLKLTYIASENRPKPKRKQSYSNHPFSGAMLVYQRVVSMFQYGNPMISMFVFCCFFGGGCHSVTSLLRDTRLTVSLATQEDVYFKPEVNSGKNPTKLQLQF